MKAHVTRRHHLLIAAGVRGAQPFGMTGKPGKPRGQFGEAHFIAVSAQDEI